jgi:hypothetical protein
MVMIYDPTTGQLHDVYKFTNVIVDPGFQSIKDGGDGSFSITASVMGQPVILENQAVA